MSTPQTGFEKRNKQGNWTTFQEEAQYINELLAQYPSIREETLGLGWTGLPIKMYKVGTGSKYTFIQAQMHGPEVAGREALLSFMRDLAISEDPIIVEYLKEYTFLCIPTCRPDSMSRRNHTNDISINTDNFNLIMPETRYIQKVISDYRPEIAVDSHESVNMPSTGTLGTMKAVHPNTHPGIANLSDSMEQEIRFGAERMGETWQKYLDHRLQHAVLTSNTYGIRNCVSILLETLRIGGSGNNTLYAERRFELQYMSFYTIVKFHLFNSNKITSAVAASVRRNEEENLDSLYLYPRRDATGPIVRPAPDGYFIPTDKYQDLAIQREIFNLPDLDSQGYLDANHRDRVVLHHLFDYQSSNSLIRTTRHYNESQHPVVSPVNDVGNLRLSVDGDRKRPSAIKTGYRGTERLVREIHTLKNDRKSLIWRSTN